LGVRFCVWKSTYTSRSGACGEPNGDAGATIALSAHRNRQQSRERRVNGQALLSEIRLADGRELMADG
jgi:hypothetical protein